MLNFIEGIINYKLLKFFEQCFSTPAGLSDEILESKLKLDNFFNNLENVFIKEL